MIVSARTHEGKVRDKNEDSYFYKIDLNKESHIFVIADGMGGHSFGDVASKMAVNSVAEFFSDLDLKHLTEDEISHLISESISYSNNIVIEESFKNRENAIMGTTLTLAILRNKKIHIGHVGDSRIYIYRNKKLLKLTEDHSFVQELIKKGEISIEEAKKHPNKNIITRALGCEKDIEIDLHQYNYIDDDVLMLCTDGLTNMLTEEYILELFNEKKDLKILCDDLINKALEAGGKDNITVIIADQIW